MFPKNLAMAIVVGTVLAVWPALAAAFDDPPPKPDRPRSTPAERSPRDVGDAPGRRAPDMRPPEPPDGEPDRPPPPPPRDAQGRPEPPPDDFHRGKAEPPPSSRWPYTDRDSMRNTDPEMYKLMKEDAELDRKSQELALQHRAAPQKDRDRIRQQLEQIVDQHFEVRQQRRLLELKRLEEEIQRLHQAIDRRAKVRKQLTQQRMTELLGSEENPKF